MGQEMVQSQVCPAAGWEESGPWHSSASPELSWGQDGEAERVKAGPSPESCTLGFGTAAGFAGLKTNRGCQSPEWPAQL